MVSERRCLGCLIFDLGWQLPNPLSKQRLSHAHFVTSSNPWLVIGSTLRSYLVVVFNYWSVQTTSITRQTNWGNNLHPIKTSLSYICFISEAVCGTEFLGRFRNWCNNASWTGFLALRLQCVMTHKGLLIISPVVLNTDVGQLCGHIQLNED